MATRCFLATSANPQDFDVGGPWAHAAEDTWPIPNSCDVINLLPRLAEVGFYHIYCARAALSALELPDTFKTSPYNVATFAVGRGVPVLIHSSPKNRRWRLWVEPAEAEGEIAA